MNDPIIIALSGHKGGGKNTLADFIYDYWYETQHFPQIVEVFAFADGIKDFCIDTLGLEHQQCYGTDDEKNTPTEYKFLQVPEWHSCYPEVINERMTGREVMQVFGTECVRAWFGNVWAAATVRKIRKAGCSLAVVTDNRFPNEVETILGQPNGYIIRLTRSPFAGRDMHPSETALDDFEWNRPNCFVLDNARMTKDEQNNAVIPILQKIFQQELAK